MSKESKNPFGSVEVVDLDNRSQEESFIIQAPEEETEQEEIVSPEEEQEEIILEGESETEVEDSPESEDDDDIDPYLYLGKIIQEDGGLDPEFELKKGLSLKDIGEAVLTKLKKEYDPELRRQALQELEREGFSERELQLAKLMRAGVDINLLQNKALVYERLSEYNEEAEELTKENTIRADYNEKGYSSDDIDTIIDKIKEKDELDSKYKESTERFHQKYKLFMKEQDQQTEDNYRRSVEAEEKSVNLIKTKLTSGEIYGEKIDKDIARELENGIFKTEILDIDGQNYNTSKFKKFMYEFERDPELRVLMFKKYLFRNSDIEGIKKEVKKEVEKEFVDAYKRSVQKSSKKSSKPQVKSQLDKEFASYGRLIEI